MKVAAAILYAIAIVAALTVAPYAEGRFIIRKVSAAVPALPTTNLVVNLAADGDVYNTGTTQATDGQTVATWVDAAGTPQNVTASGTDQPIWRAGGGVPYLEFDGNDYMRHSGSIMTGAASTIYAVVQTDDITAVQVAVELSDSGTANHYVKFGNTTNPTNGTAWYQVKGTTAYTARSSSQLSNGVTAIIHGNNNAADTDRSVWINNAGVGNDTNTGNYNYTSGARQYIIGASYSNASEGSNFDGKIYHVLIYDEEHDASERSDTIAYLQNKWGL